MIVTHEPIVSLGYSEAELDFLAASEALKALKLANSRRAKAD